ARQGGRCGLPRAGRRRRRRGEASRAALSGGQGSLCAPSTARSKPGGGGPVQENKGPGTARLALDCAQAASPPGGGGARSGGGGDEAAGVHPERYGRGGGAGRPRAIP